MKKLLMVFPLVFLFCFTFSCQQGEEVAEKPAVDIEAEKANIQLFLNQYVKTEESEDKEMHRKLHSEIFSHDDDMVIFSAVPNERYFGWEEFTEAIKKETYENWEQYTDFKGTLKDIVIKVHDSGKVTWVSCYEDWNFKYQGQPSSPENIRTTFVLEKRNDNWIIVHAHWSLNPRGSE